LKGGFLGEEPLIVIVTQNRIKKSTFSLDYWTLMIHEFSFDITYEVDVMWKRVIEELYF